MAGAANPPAGHRDRLLPPQLPRPGVADPPTGVAPMDKGNRSAYQLSWLLAPEDGGGAWICARWIHQPVAVAARSRRHRS
uniref:Uncharacterized protein n=1 Tax=Oryza meridionalis TaxID=40149 RepID=A0A0E0ELP8_9ORYZ